MRRELDITTDKIDEAALLKRRKLLGDMGAVVCFSGIVRGEEDGNPIAALDYEVFAPMARRRFDWSIALGGLRRENHRFGWKPSRRIGKRRLRPVSSSLRK